MSLEEKVDQIHSAVNRIEGAIPEIKENHQREIRAVHTRIREVREELSEDIGEVHEVAKCAKQKAVAAGTGNKQAAGGIAVVTAGVITGIAHAIKTLLGMEG